MNEIESPYMRNYRAQLRQERVALLRVYLAVAIATAAAFLAGRYL